MPIENLAPARKANALSNIRNDVPAPQANQPAVAADSLTLSSAPKVQAVADKLKAAIAAYDTIWGLHWPSTWRESAQRNEDALDEMLLALRSDPELAERFHVVIQSTDGYLTYHCMFNAESIHGPLGWHKFADEHRRWMGQALSALETRT